MAIKINNSKTPFHVFCLSGIHPSPITTKAFFPDLHEKNIQHSSDIRGLVNQKYNEILNRHGHTLGLIPRINNFEGIGLDLSTEILYPALYAQAFKEVLDPLENHTSCNDHIYQLIKSHIPIPSTGTFFYFLHDKNIKHMSNIRGMVNEKYNELLRMNQRPMGIIPGGNQEILGNDQLTQIFYPHLYLEAYEAVLKPKEEDFSINDPIYLAISSFKTQLFTKSFFQTLHERNVVHQENIRARVYQRYNMLLGQNNCTKGIIPGGENLEILGSNQSEQILYPELFAQAYREILDPLENGSALSLKLRASVCSFIDNGFNRDAPKENTNGVSDVYFPKLFPQIIIKKSLGLGNRLKQMEQAKQICKEWNLSHLFVPDAFCYNGLLVEQRVPIATDLCEQIAFYVEHHRDLTSAVKDFVEFYCLTHFGDLNGDCHNKILCDAAIGRYDNIPFFYDPKENKYCIGLIDLEHFQPCTSPKNKDEIARSIQDALNFFPLHFKEIIEIGEKYCKNVSERINLENHRKALRFFNVFQAYRAHLLEQGISPAHPARLPELTLNRVDEILKKSLKSIRKRKYYKIDLSPSSENYEDFIKTAPNIFRKIHEEMSVLLRDGCEAQGNNILYFHQLAKVRIVFGLYEEETIYPEIKKLLVLKEISNSKRAEFCSEFFHIVMKKMQKKEIFEYYPARPLRYIFL